MKKVVLIILILLLIYYFLGRKSENFDPNGQSTKIVLYEDYRQEDPKYIYDRPGKLDLQLKINLKSAMISSGNRTVEIWRIWDSPNSNSTSINSDFYSYIVPYGMRANSGKYQMLAKVEPDKTEKIEFKDQVSRIRLIIY